jgi:hypothetical protein
MTLTLADQERLAAIEGRLNESEASEFRRAGYGAAAAPISTLGDRTSRDSH